MWKLLSFLFIGHQHKWKIHEETEWSNFQGECGRAFWLQCEHCGKMKYVHR